MGELTSGISILLGSAVVSTIITTIFNQYDNRKNNTLKYITEERKKWRETIRSISEKIQTCEFHGQDEKNIEKYLVELELNINSCGWGSKNDIKEDAYIWDEINQIRRVDNEDYFKKHKELLIYYISIMLKEDWDRSKNEVNGYSQVFVEILTLIFANSAVCCLYLHIGMYQPHTWITVIGKTGIYTLIVYGFIKLIFLVAEVIRIRLGDKFVIYSFFKVMIVEVVILFGLLVVPIALNIQLKKVAPNESVFNIVVGTLCYIEIVIIFGNWAVKSARYEKFCIKIYTSRREMLNEAEIKLKKYKSDMEEMYHYVKSNQNDFVQVKPVVVSLQRLFKEYKKEIRRYRRNEYRKTMTAETRDKIGQLEKDLNDLEDREKKIYNYYSVGLNEKIKLLPGILAGKLLKLRERLERIGKFFYKKRGTL